MRRSLSVVVVAGISFATVSFAQQQPAAKLTVDAKAAGKPVSRTMYGLFFEDINYSGDGGLYAELIQNRSFEHEDGKFTWSPAGSNGTLTVLDKQPLNKINSHYLRIESKQAGFGAVNSGWEGIPVKQGAKYWVGLWAHAGDGFRGTIVARLEGPGGENLGEASLTGFGAQWKKVEGVITASADAPDARLAIIPGSTGAVDVDMVSLFPQETFKQRRNGMRADLAQLLADVKPGFMRFPGGCIVEGNGLPNAYRWKDTVGPLEERKQNWNRWKDNGKFRYYYQTYGLGFFEFFQLCEDIGTEPVPVMNCGMACQFTGGQLVPMNELKPWIDDILDLIEFANGPATSKWGALRAKMGHPQPFNLKTVGVGNEQWGGSYFERYKVFYDAIKAKYPAITIITTSGPGVGQEDINWRFAWDQFRKGVPAQIVDEHFYRPPEWMLTQDTRYDSYDPKGPKVFAGEYASHVEGRRNNLYAGITEAAFMTGLERNADIVRMACYAPLFAKVGYTQWQPDMIWFDNTRSMPTPSYFVQSLYAQNLPDVAVPVVIAQPDAKGAHGRIGVGAWNTQAEFKDIKVTKDGQTLFASAPAKGLDGWQQAGGTWSVKDGAFQQSGNDAPGMIYAGDPSWTDYTLSVKARKLGGAEGFLIAFQAPNERDKSWWNIGGWGNREAGLEIPGAIPPRVPQVIETGRWYDIRIELKGNQIRLSMDGKLLQEVQRTGARTLYATAGRMNSAGEMIVKAINVSEDPMPVQIDLNGLPAAPLAGTETVLTSTSFTDENTLEEPTKVSPKTEKVQVAGPSFSRTLPARSMTVLRLKAAQ